MNLAELARRLEERDGTITIARAHQEWCVWLYAGDDPAAAFFVEVDPNLETAVRDAFKKWDEAEVEERVVTVPGPGPKSADEVDGPIEITDDD